MKEKNKKNYLIALIIGVILILFGLYFVINRDDGTLKKDDKNPYNGIFTKDNQKIYVYQDNDSIYFTFDKYTYGRASINGNEATGYQSASATQYSFSLENDDLVIKTDNEKYSGLYKREHVITIDEYFNVLFGDSNYFNSKYNGLYKRDNDELYIFQTGSNKVQILLTTETGSLKTEFDIKSSNELVMANVQVYIINLVDEKTISLQLAHDVNTDVFVGKYIKEKSITISDVLKYNGLYYY